MRAALRSTAVKLCYDASTAVPLPFFPFWLDASCEEVLEMCFGEAAVKDGRPCSAWALLSSASSCRKASCMLWFACMNSCCLRRSIECLARLWANLRSSRSLGTSCPYSLSFWMASSAGLGFSSRRLCTTITFSGLIWRCFKASSFSLRASCYCAVPPWI